MFITFLKFAANRGAVPEFMATHNAWIARGFADGVFLCAGGLEAAAGGVILAHGESRTEHDARIAADPFVIQGIVTAETHEIAANRTAPALDFLRGAA